MPYLLNYVLNFKKPVKVHTFNFCFPSRPSRILDLQKGGQGPGEVKEQHKGVCLLSSNFNEIRTCIFTWKCKKHYFLSPQQIFIEHQLQA